MNQVYVINNETYFLEGIVDKYESLIWTDRYYEAGDFELYLPATDKYLSLFHLGYYLRIETSDHQMVVESIQTTSSLEEGNMMTVRGRSIECLLCRRIVWNHLKFNGNIQNQVKNLIDQSFINPSIANRKVPNMVFVESTNQEVIDATYSDDSDLIGKELYDVLNDVCSTSGLGFRIILTEDNIFEFSLYKGVDRSYAQEATPHVIVSPAFDNIVSSDYRQDADDYKNYALVMGTEQPEMSDDPEEPAEPIEVFVTSGDDTLAGLNRREIYVNASDVQSEEVPNFQAALKTRGEKELETYTVKNFYDGEIEPNVSFVYNKNYFIGDIIQLENGLNVQTRVLIAGFVISVDTSGSSSYPEFEFIDSEDNTV